MSFGPIEALVIVCIMLFVVGIVKWRRENKPLTLMPPPMSTGGDPDPPRDSGADTRQDRMRRQRFEAAVQSAVAQGWTIESRSEYQAILVRGQRVNHILHLILTVLTLGFWGIVWILLAIGGGQKREVLTVDQVGAVTTQRR